MLKLAERQLLALLLCALMVNPPSIFAASTPSASRAVLGSIATNGSVRVGEVLVPTEGTLFSGDRVNTNNGNATIQYRDGARVQLASESLADFAPGRIQLEKGLMSFSTVSADGMVFSASTLRLEPTTAKSAANVTLKDTKASVSVTEGTVKVIDPSGTLLASLKAGDARLFEEAPSSSSAADPAAAPSAAAAPQGGGSSGNNHWLIAAGLAVAGIALGIAGIVKADDASNSADKANAAALAAQQQVTALQATVSSVTARLNALILTVTADAAASSQLRAITVDLDIQLGNLTAIQVILATPGVTPAQIAAALTRLATLTAAVNTDLGLLNALNFPGGGSPATPTRVSQVL